MSTAVLSGVLLGGSISIVEYNVLNSSGEQYSVGIGLILGSVIAGLLVAGPRRLSLLAGGYTGAIQLLILAPLAALVYHAETTSLSPDTFDTFFVASIVILGPAVIVGGFMLGVVGGFIGYILASILSRTS